MKKICVILSMLLILISVSACKINNTTPTTERPDYLSEIMKKSDECHFAFTVISYFAVLFVTVNVPFAVVIS